MSRITNEKQRKQVRSLSLSTGTWQWFQRESKRTRTPLSKLVDTALLNYIEGRGKFVGHVLDGNHP